MSGIQIRGGSILGTDRIHFEPETVLKNLKEKGITQLYVVGGMGTHRALKMLQDAALKSDARVQIVSIPTTIDHNTPIIDNSIGFSTAIQESVSFINAAKTECEAAEYCIGMVRIIGRNSGIIAVNAALASRDCNIVVIPEVHFQLYGSHGLYESIIERFKTKNDLVLVVAEGAYKGLVPACKDKVDEEN